MAETGSQEIADCTAGFEITDPYEMCFALFYLIDTGDDSPWLINSGHALMLCVQRMLPWYIDKSDWEPEDIDAWYEGMSYDRNDWLEQDNSDEVNFYQKKHGDKNLAQLIYDLCHTVVPVGMHPFEKDRSKFIKEGMDENLARKITDLAELMFFYEFQSKLPFSSNFDFKPDEVIETHKASAECEVQDVSSVIENKDKDAALSQDSSHQIASSNMYCQPEPKISGGYWGRVMGISEDTAGSKTDESKQALQPKPDVNSLNDEIAALKQQIKTLKKTLAVSSQELLKEKTRYEQELKTLRLEHRELADLREIVFNQNADQNATEKRESLGHCRCQPI